MKEPTQEQQEEFSKIQRAMTNQTGTAKRRVEKWKKEYALNT